MHLWQPPIPPWEDVINVNSPPILDSPLNHGSSQLPGSGYAARQVRGRGLRRGVAVGVVLRSRGDPGECREARAHDPSREHREVSNAGHTHTHTHTHTFSLFLYLSLARALCVCVCVCNQSTIMAILSRSHTQCTNRVYRLDTMIMAFLLALTQVQSQSHQVLRRGGQRDQEASSHQQLLKLVGSLLENPKPQQQQQQPACGGCRASGRQRAGDPHRCDQRGAVHGRTAAERGRLDGRECPSGNKHRSEGGAGAGASLI
eukprot:SAG11_NODE_20_length_25330_cov_18.348143_4_plen_259_part_00